jgi:hypothetical protein
MNELGGLVNLVKVIFKPLKSKRSLGESSRRVAQGSSHTWAIIGLVSTQVTQAVSSLSCPLVLALPVPREDNVSDLAIHHCDLLDLP